MSTTREISRRRFGQATVAATTAAGLTAVQAQNIAGANDRVRVGMIGVGNRGGQLLEAFLGQSDVEIPAICDIYEPYLQRTSARLEGRAETYRDFRKLIDRADIDAVVVASPDHWHAIQTITACDAGKDVYVEKPLSITIREGRRMVEAARRNAQVVQVGTQRRSSPLYNQLAKIAHAGKLGKITASRAFRLNNMYPDGIGKRQASPPPKDLDWNLWLGPRPARAFQDNIAPYKFRWWQLYSSQMANWGVHYLDAIRWMIDQQAPASVCAMGGVFAVQDDRTIPDTAEAIFQFAAGHLALFATFEASGNPALREGELELRGSQGIAYIGGRRFRVIPERGGQFQDWEPQIEAMEETGGQRNAGDTADHVRNFLDCVKSRERPAADVEIGHRSTTMSLLSNISLATNSRLEWDARQETITSPQSANDLLHYEYRSPWTLE